MDEAVYSPLFFPTSREKETFLTSFTRIALADEKGEQDMAEEQQKIQPYLDLIRKIPNFELLNAHMMWIALSAYSLLGDTHEERKRKFNDYAEIQNVIKGQYITRMIRNVFPYKKTEKKKGDAELMYEKITREVYLYLYMLI